MTPTDALRRALQEYRSDVDDDAAHGVDWTIPLAEPLMAALAALDAAEQSHDEWLTIAAAAAEGSEKREAALRGGIEAVRKAVVELPAYRMTPPGTNLPGLVIERQAACEAFESLRPTISDTQQAATARDAALLAQGAETERQDILAGIREHIPACEDERGGRYDCIHGIDSATGTVVLRLAELHREGVALLSQPQKAVCRDCGGPSDGYLVLSPELTEPDECPPFCERCGRAYCVKHLDATWHPSKETE